MAQALKANVYGAYDVEGAYERWLHNILNTRLANQ